MPAKTLATVILATWAVLLFLYAANRYGIKSRFLRVPVAIHLPSDSRDSRDSRDRQVRKPGTFWSHAGVLFVFSVNIGTLGLVFLMALFPSMEAALHHWRFMFPLWVHAAGGILFVLHSIWGLLVMLFNPNYTPLYRPLPDQFFLATQGPYHLVRHPRYATEALLNVTLVLFTGFWLPLLGLLAWKAVYGQARDEERVLLTLAAEAYGAYYRRTGMFFPRIGRGSKK